MPTLSKNLQKFIKESKDLEQALINNKAMCNTLFSLNRKYAPAASRRDHKGCEIRYIKYVSSNINELGHLAGKFGDLDKIYLLSTASDQFYYDFIYNALLGAIEGEHIELITPLKNKLNNPTDFNTRIFEENNFKELNILEYAINKKNQALAEYAMIKLKIININPRKIYDDNETNQLYDHCLSVIRNKKTVIETIETKNNLESKSQYPDSLIRALLSLMKDSNSTSDISHCASSIMKMIFEIKLNGKEKEKQLLAENEQELLNAIIQRDGDKIINIAPKLSTGSPNLGMALVILSALIIVGVATTITFCGPAVLLALLIVPLLIIKAGNCLSEGHIKKDRVCDLGSSLKNKSIFSQSVYAPGERVDYDANNTSNPLYKKSLSPALTLY